MPRHDGRLRPTWWSTIVFSFVFISVTVVFLRRTGVQQHNDDNIMSSEQVNKSIHQLHSGSLSSLSFYGTRRHRVCMFFDWPPWTRSSVIAHSLKQCWGKRLGFQLASYDDYNQRSEAMSTMLNLSSPFVAMVGQHMHLTQDEIDLMKHACDYRYYVTTTRRVEERVFYAYKSELLGSRYITGRDLEMTDDLVKWVKTLVVGGKTSNLVTKLERYPFDNQTLGPDYVIRAASFSSELMKLLDAFGCKDDLPDPNLDLSEHWDEQAITIEDIIDSSDMVEIKNDEKDDEDDGNETEQTEGLDDDQSQAQPSIAPILQGDAFRPEGPNDQLLADLLFKGVDSGEIVFRKLRGHGYRHNERGLQKIKEVLAIRFGAVADLPVDKEAVSMPNVAPIGTFNER